MTRTLFNRTRPADLDRELARLRTAHAELHPSEGAERRALDRLIRCRERLRRRLSAGLPACRTT